jgi:hypothetical protein
VAGARKDHPAKTESRRLTCAGKDHAAEAGVRSECIGRGLRRPDMAEVSMLRKTACAENNCQRNCT